MQCPFCGGEMKHGFLHTGITLWSERRHNFSLNPSDDEFYALKLDRPLLRPHQVESEYCPSCQKMIVDCGKYDKKQ